MGIEYRRLFRVCFRDHSVYAPGQWEMALHCNAVSHWLDAYTEWSLMFCPMKILTFWLKLHVYWSIFLGFWLTTSPQWFGWWLGTEEGTSIYLIQYQGLCCQKPYQECPQTSIISNTLLGSKLVDHSDVVGASPVGAAPTTSAFLT